MKNILILNAGTRNVLIRDFKETFKGQCKIIATDSFELAPAIYDADIHYVTKRWDASGYWDEITDICKKENVGLIMSLIDPELELLAKEKERFEELGILVNVGEYDVIKRAFDKYETLEFIKEKGYPWIKSFIDCESVLRSVDAEDVTFPLIAKPRKGSGSAGIVFLRNTEEVQKLFEEQDDYIVQEFINGQEIGVDVYVDLLSGKVASLFAKKKIKMRSGETDKSCSYLNEKLFELVKDFALSFGLKGSNDIDVFEVDGEFYISEVNPRFGGGYIHAYAAGENFPKLLMNNMCGMENEPRIGMYEEGLYMMKYFDIKIMTEEELK